MLKKGMSFAATFVFLFSCRNAQISHFEKSVEIRPIIYMDIVDPKIDPACALINNSFSLTPRGDIFLIDYPRHRVLRINAEGNILNQIGGIGQGKDDLYNPFGVSCFGGNVYILNNLGKELKCFTSQGEFISSFHIEDTEETNSIYVCDKGILLTTRKKRKLNQDLYDYNSQQLLSFYGFDGRKEKSLGKTIRCKTTLGHLKFNSTFIQMKKDMIIGAFNNVPVIFAYDLIGRELFYRDLKELRLSEIIARSEDVRRRGMDTPDSIKEENRLDYKSYCGGIAFYRNEIYYALNSDSIVYVFNNKGELKNELRLSLGDEPVRIQAIEMTDAGNFVGLANIFGSNRLFFFKSVNRMFEHR